MILNFSGFEKIELVVDVSNIETYDELGVRCKEPTVWLDGEFLLVDGIRRLAQPESGDALDLMEIVNFERLKTYRHTSREGSPIEVNLKHLRRVNTILPFMLKVVKPASKLPCGF